MEIFKWFFHVTRGSSGKLNVLAIKVAKESSFWCIWLLLCDTVICYTIRKGKVGCQQGLVKICKQSQRVEFTNKLWYAVTDCPSPVINRMLIFFISKSSIQVLGSIACKCLFCAVYVTCPENNQYAVSSYNKWCLKVRNQDANLSQILFPLHTHRQCRMLGHTKRNQNSC